MYRCRLEGADIVYGAEMDGIESGTPVDLNTTDLNNLNFIELKVKLKEERPNQHRNYLKFKVRNWWCQLILGIVLHCNWLTIEIHPFVIFVSGILVTVGVRGFL